MDTFITGPPRQSDPLTEADLMKSLQTIWDLVGRESPRLIVSLPVYQFVRKIRRQRMWHGGKRPIQNRKVLR